MPTVHPTIIVVQDWSGRLNANPSPTNKFCGIVQDMIDQEISIPCWIRQQHFRSHPDFSIRPFVHDPHRKMLCCVVLVELDHIDGHEELQNSYTNSQKIFGFVIFLFVQ